MVLLAVGGGFGSFWVFACFSDYVDVENYVYMSITSVVGRNERKIKLICFRERTL